MIIDRDLFRFCGQHKKLWPEKKLAIEYAVSGLLDYLPDMYMMKRFIGTCLIGARAVSQDRFALRLALLSPDRPASGCIT